MDNADEDVHDFDDSSSESADDASNDEQNDVADEAQAVVREGKLVCNATSANSRFESADLAKMSMLDILKLKEKVGKKAFAELMGAKSSDKPAEPRRKSKQEFKRANKNRPREMSSKRPVRDQPKPKSQTVSGFCQLRLTFVRTRSTGTRGLNRRQESSSKNYS